MISATQALDLIASGRHALIDVRSEGEFAQGQIPGFINVPILTDAERHQVGLAYKQTGQAAAIKLGEELVAPHAGERIKNWQRLASAKPDEAIVTCWRGGLRSQLTCERLREVGCEARRVVGGYKAMRHELLHNLESPPPLLVLGGLTGSGKTRLLTALPLAEKIDLEGLAAHRGSSFGAYLDHPQPTQATFENSLAWGIRKFVRPVVVEDESAAIGHVRLPAHFFAAKQGAPLVWLDTPMAERVANIHEEYIKRPLDEGFSSEVLSARLGAGIKNLTRRLGEELTRTIEQGVTEAFRAGKTDLASHGRWIEVLLADYYDKSYLYAFKRVDRQVAFRGTSEECRQWILQRYD